jgi:tRNA A-37 threonylcarbamoyl transferase component Bud32
MSRALCEHRGPAMRARFGARMLLAWNIATKGKNIMSWRTITDAQWRPKLFFAPGVPAVKIGQAMSMSNAAAREETIFNIARQLTHPQDRFAYLDDACGADTPLRQRVERLLGAEHEANEFLAANPLTVKEVPPAQVGRERKQTDQPTTPSAPVAGDVIEDYEIIEKIGGNMGLVFKARHRLLDKIVALKLLPAHYITDPARLARFQRELRVMGQLEHPNLVTAADARVVGCWHIVAMELIDGIDLQRIVEDHGALPVAAACEAVRQAALALQHAHQHGLIHRDIKPSNLMLTHSGTIKVIDMGLAMMPDDTTVQLTQTGLVLGTMSYCAPEQFRDASRVDIRADIYSLGCTLFHLLTGKAPYAERKTLAEVMQAHLHEPFPKLHEAQPDAPAELEPVLARMTAKDPDSRFATPGEVAQALEPFARAADLKPFVSARTGQAGSGRVSTRRTPPMPEAGRPARARQQRSKARWARVTGLVVLLVAVAGAVFLAVKRPQSETAITNRVPVVVLMDTIAKDGIYDQDNKDIGASNAREVSTALEAEGVPIAAHPEPLHAGWARETAVIAKKPDLLIIHRSSFHHSFNAVFNFGRATDGFAQPLDDPMWRFLYNDVGDDKLITLLGCIGNEVPHTKFLVYSRGTDTNWLSEDFRVQWVREVEERFPKLKDRVSTMVIPNGYTGSFRQTDTRALLRTNVIKILGLPDKRERAGNLQARQNP